MSCFLRPAWLLAIALLMSGIASAHQAKEAITRVLFNPRTENIEVMHRFLVHDAEHAVREIFAADADILGSANTRDRFAEYVSQRFSLHDQQGQPIPLQAVGHEIDGRYLWVYAEAPIPSKLESLSVRHQALRDIWPAQVNLLNVDYGGESQSALFSGGTTEVQIRLR